MGSSGAAGKRSRTFSRALRGALGTAALVACAVFAVACGGHGITPVPNPNVTPARGTVGHGAFFVPVVPPYSPNTPYSLAGRNNGALASTAPAASPMSDHWFYLVNGYELQTPTPGVPGSAPVPQITPYVLGVTGPAPAGAPAPNGGVTVGTVALGSTSLVNALWKIVQVTPGSTSKSQQFFLRSAQSFAPNQPWVGTTPFPNSAKPPAGTFPSMLTGFATQAVNLDVGAAASLAPGVYMNQSTAPFTSGQTTFQQWYYDVNTQTVNNGLGGVLAQSCTPMGNQGCVSVAPGASGQQSRWYAYPNYQLSAVIAEPTSGPAFPQPSVTTAPSDTGTTDIAGEEAAYYYISANAFALSSIASLPRCTIPGEPGYAPNNTTYGIRCNYVNVNSSGNVIECASVANGPAPANAVQPYNPTNPSLTATITTADWTVVARQMHAECTYAYNVMQTFSAYDGILKVVFTGSSNTFAHLSGEIGQTQKTTFAPNAILRGIVYTTLSAGNKFSGILANLLQTTIDYGDARKTNLTSPLSATSTSFYGAINNVFLADQKNEAAIEQTIVWSWQRLKIIGPLAEQDGPNGLGLAAADQVAIESEALNAYQTMFLQIFYPLVYDLQFSPAGADIYGGPPTYATYQYPAFGSSGGVPNTSVLCGSKLGKDCPSKALMTSPVPLPQQSQFTLFNGLNGWSQIQRISFPRICYDAMGVLFNATPNTLTVNVTATLGGTQVVTPSGLGSGYSGTLNPYGYFPIYVEGNPVANLAGVTAHVASGGSNVANVYFTYEACQKNGKNNVTSISIPSSSTASGWSLYPSSSDAGKYPYPSPNLQNGAYNGFNGPQLMWLVIGQ